jgi:transposase
MKKHEEVQKCFIGIDVSKLSIDVSFITPNGEHVYEAFGNNPKDFKQMEKWLNKNKSFNYKSALFCMEHTGLYTRELVSFLLQRQANVWMESALHISEAWA